jgi:pimeloyl-ACP methyl ester carboxylesterase
MVRLLTQSLRPVAFAPVLMASSLFLGGCSGHEDSSQAPPAPRDQIQGPAGTLHVNDGGTGGVPVVFVHGYGGDSEQWSPQLAHLRTTRRAVALDLRGHGKSAAPATNDYAVESLAADISAVVDSLGLTRFVLVGHSMGGSASIAYAAAHPDRVAGLVMVGAPGRTPPEMGQQIMAQIEANYDSVTSAYWEQLLTDAQPAVRERVRSRMRSVPKEPSLAIIGTLMRYDPLPQLSQYPGPKLAVHTSHENTPNDLQNLVTGLPHRAIEQASHWMHMDKPEEFNRILDEFLGSVS